MSVKVMEPTCSGPPRGRPEVLERDRVTGCSSTAGDDVTAAAGGSSLGRGLIAGCGGRGLTGRVKAEVDCVCQSVTISEHIVYIWYEWEKMQKLL